MTLTRTQKRLLRELRDGATLYACLNKGEDFMAGAATFARGMIWTMANGKWINSYASRTVEALWPRYIDQPCEASGNERYMKLTDEGRKAIT